MGRSRCRRAAAAENIAPPPWFPAMHAMPPSAQAPCRCHVVMRHRATAPAPATICSPPPIGIASRAAAAADCSSHHCVQQLPAEAAVEVCSQQTLVGDQAQRQLSTSPQCSSTSTGSDLGSSWRDHDLATATTWATAGHGDGVEGQGDLPVARRKNHGRLRSVCSGGFPHGGRVQRMRGLRPHTMRRPPDPKV